MLVPILFSVAILYLLAYNFLSRTTPEQNDIRVSREKELSFHHILGFQSEALLETIANRKEFMDDIYRPYSRMLMRDMRQLLRTRPFKLAAYSYFLLFWFVYPFMRLRRIFRTHQRDLMVLIGATALICRCKARG